jgi:hypothetical protein
MAAVLPKTIMIRRQPGNRRREAPAAGALVPGHLVQYNSTGGIVVQSTAAIDCRRLFAVENDLIGKGIDDAYASGDYVQMEECVTGNDVYALLAAAATAVTQGAYLEAAADGTLRIWASGTKLAQALEAVDNSGGGAAARIRVAIL